MGKILSISHKLTPNTLCCHGLRYEGTTGGERNLVKVDDKPNLSTNNEKVASRALH